MHLRISVLVDDEIRLGCASTNQWQTEKCTEGVQVVMGAKFAFWGPSRSLFGHWGTGWSGIALPGSFVILFCCLRFFSIDTQSFEFVLAVNCGRWMCIGVNLLLVK